MCVCVCVCVCVYETLFSVCEFEIYDFVCVCVCVCEYETHYLVWVGNFEVCVSEYQTHHFLCPSMECMNLYVFFVTLETKNLMKLTTLCVWVWNTLFSHTHTQFYLCLNMIYLLVSEYDLLTCVWIWITYLCLNMNYLLVSEYELLTCVWIWITRIWLFFLKYVRHEISRNWRLCGWIRNFLIWLLTFKSLHACVYCDVVSLSLST